jgi:hypothetical protein
MAIGESGNVYGEIAASSLSLSGFKKLVNMPIVLSLCHRFKIISINGRIA